MTLLSGVVDAQRKRLVEVLEARGFKGVTFPRLRLAQVILTTPGSIGQLARAQGLTKQVCSRQVKELARLGYAKIGDSRDDARASTVVLTGRGIKLLEALRAAKRAREAVLTRRLGRTTMARLEEALRQLLDD